MTAKYCCAVNDVVKDVDNLSVMIFYMYFPLGVIAIAIVKL